MNMQFGAQSAFGPMFNFSGNQNASMQYSESQFPGHPGFGLQYLYPFQDRRSQLMSEHAAAGDSKAESKPRLSKEEVDKLERIFQENPKPSSSVKAQLADELNLERPRINNWFQNRRAKAKQEKRQEEYEARRMAEKELSSASTPLSLDESATASRPGYFAEPIPKRMNPSTALFPDFDTVDEPVSDNSPLAEEQVSSSISHSDIPRRDNRALFHTLPSLDMHAAQSHVAAFSPESMSSPNFGSSSMGNYSAFMSSAAEFRQMKDASSTTNHGLPSPEEDDTVSEAALRIQYNGVQARSFSCSMASPINGELILPQPYGVEAMDSFKSPPPPANIASRRKIPRPAALQAASLKSRGMASGTTPKTVLDGSRRLDPSSPATAMRRIVSGTGNMSGRIQKSVAGPRSPMFFARNSEALLQYHTRSPASSVGPLTSPFSAAPTTPMTPAVMGMQSIAEPEVTTSADDEPLLLGSSTPIGLLNGIRGGNADLKTPPGTPGIILNSAMHFPLQNYASNAELVDQPLLTPYFQSNFSELNSRSMPSYLDLNGSSLPSTPLYPNMPAMNSASMLPHSSTGSHSDWDATESVTSSRSSPGLAQSQVQYTQNMTPHEYNLYER